MNIWKLKESFANIPGSIAFLYFPDYKPNKGIRLCQYVNISKKIYPYVYNELCFGWVDFNGLLVGDDFTLWMEFIDPKDIKIC